MEVHHPIRERVPESESALNRNSTDSDESHYKETLKRFDLLEINSEININLDNNILDFYKKYEQLKKCYFIVQTFNYSNKIWEIKQSKLQEELGVFSFEKKTEENEILNDSNANAEIIVDLIKRKIEYILYLIKNSKTEIEQSYYLKMQKYLPIINLQINEFKNQIFDKKLKYFLKKKIEMKEFKNDFYNPPNIKKDNTEVLNKNAHELIRIVFDPFYDLNLALIESDKKFFICFKSLEENGQEPIEIKYNENNVENTFDRILFFKISKFYNNLLILGVKDGVKKLIKINYIHNLISKIELVRVINESGEITFLDELHIQNKTYTIYETKNNLKFFDNLSEDSDSAREIQINDCGNFNVNQKTNYIFLTKIQEKKIIGYSKRINHLSDLQELVNIYDDEGNKMFELNQIQSNIKTYLFENYNLIYFQNNRDQSGNLSKLKLFCDNKSVYEFSKYPELENLFLTRTSENELIIITINSNDVFVFLFNENDKKCSVIQTIDVRKHLNKYRLQLDHGNQKTVGDLTDFILYNEDEKKLIREDGSAYNVIDENKVINIYEKLKIKKSYFDHYSNKIFLHLETDIGYQNICVLDIVNM